MAKIRVNLPDSDFTPYDESTTSSKFTFHGGNAVRLAALDARKQILKIARRTFAVKSYNELDMTGGFVFAKKDPENKKTISSLLTSGHYGKLSNVVGRGAFFSDYARPLDPKTSQSSRATACWMYAAHGAEVEVDEQTGAVKILRVVAAHDVGKAINPMGCEQQIEGGVLMGIGQAISEQLIMEKGNVLNPGFKDYKIPTARDLPEIIPKIVEVKHWKGPFGAKGLGEVPIAPTPAAIANAVSDAVGIRIFDLPLTPEKILRAIKEKING
jgi:carbon-monoxide dehydrogenase large subunit